MREYAVITIGADLEPIDADAIFDVGESDHPLRRHNMLDLISCASMAASSAEVAISELKKYNEGIQTFLERMRKKYPDDKSVQSCSRMKTKMAEARESVSR